MQRSDPRRRALEVLAIVIAIYAGIVVALETLVVTMGMQQAARGVAPDENWLVITTTGADGSSDTVVAGVESEGDLYVSANHWPRNWYDRALKNPQAEITRTGKRMTYRAMPVVGAERERVARDYHLPWVIRLLSGFPPRSFLRLDAASG